MQKAFSEYRSSSSSNKSKMKYHFKCKTGWQGSPCGLAFFKGRYHLFYLTNPEANRYGNISWGHAVSDDFCTWEEQGIVLPEGSLGGSVLVHDGKLWLFHTREGEQGVFASVLEDVEKCNNVTSPAVIGFAGDDIKYQTFRDPYVFRHKNSWFMTVGAGSEGVAKILLYKSDDLTNWEFKSEILSDSRFGSAIESPSIFELEDTWVLMFQGQMHVPTRVLLATGEFDGEGFTFENPSDPFISLETGTEYYNPAPFEDEDGRKGLIAWLFSTKLGTGMLTVPREIFVDFNGKLALLPHPDLMPAMKAESRFVDFDKGTLSIKIEGRTLFTKMYRTEPDIGTIEDTESVELFINNGSENISMLIC